MFRKKTQGEDAVHGMADTAGVRRLHFIYARALRKFKGDLRLWHSYLAFCKSNGAAKRLDRALTQALQLHSGVPALWVYAAGWEVSSSPPSGGRSGRCRGSTVVSTSAEHEGVKRGRGGGERSRLGPVWSSHAPSSSGGEYSDAKVANRNVRVWHGATEMALERWTNPRRSRRTCACEYGLQLSRGGSAGVTKRPRERSPTANPLTLRSATLPIALRR